MTEMSSVSLVLKPQHEATIPAWLGRAAQASFLHSLQKVHPELSRTIHDAHGAKPFTSSTLIGARKADDMVQLSPNNTLRLRYTTLHSQVTTLFHHGILPQWEDKTIYVHHQPLDVIEVQVSDNINPWVEQADYVELVDNASTQHKISLTFTSPTSFKRTQGGFTPLPQPDLVFSSLLTRWNAFAPFRLPDWLYDTVHDDIVVDHAKIQTETLSFARGNKGIVRGFRGKVTFRLLCKAEARRYLQALASFAKFSGIGVKTTMGMGQAKVA